MSLKRRLHTLERYANQVMTKRETIDISLLDDKDRARFLECAVILTAYYEYPKRLESERRAREAAIKIQGEEVVKREELIWHLISESEHTLDYATASAMVRSGKYHRTDEEIAELKEKQEAEYLERVEKTAAELEALTEKAKKLSTP